MKKKASIVVAILLLAVGFAAVSTTLIINGSVKLGENTDDFSVIFTKATLDGTDVYASVIDNTKKTITFETSDLKTLNQTSVLNYEVTNNSANYDAEVQVNCKTKENTTAKYTRIKNELEGNATVIKAKETLNGTLTVTLNKVATEEVREEYVCTLTLNAVERDTIGVEPTLYDLIKSKADTTTVIDYKVNSGASGTNGIYTTTATEGSVPVYYFRGDADKVNNNIIFNNMCWKIIRTTETGGVKLIYNGTPNNGKCETQTGDSTQIGKSQFSGEGGEDNAYVGYMYGTVGSTTYAATHTNINDSTIKKYIDNWYSQNFDESATSKLEDTVFCNDRSTKAYDANTIGTSLSYYGALGYGKNATLYGAAHRASYWSNNPNPSLVCQNQNDKFTVDSKNGNGKLTYPVGLITLDEAVLAGFNTNYSNENDYKDYTNYLYTNSVYWTFSPVTMEVDRNGYTGIYGGAKVGFVNIGSYYSGSYVDNGIVGYSYGVRPVVSLANGTFVTGFGTTTNPYVVK